MIEGSGLIREALAAGFKLQQIFSAQSALGAQFGPEFTAPEQYQLDAELMLYVSTLPSPPDAIGIFGQREIPEDPARLSAWLLADRLQDPGNFGALLRLADACNWRGVIAVGGHPDPYSSKVIRGSMASCLRVPVISLSAERLAQWQAEGWQLVGTAADAPVSSLNCELPQQLILALGHEGQGLAPELVSRCDLTVSIPIRAGVDSLNVATAGAMLMHEYLRQHGPQPAPQHQGVN